MKAFLNPLKNSMPHIPGSVFGTEPELSLLNLPCGARETTVYKA